MKYIDFTIDNYTDRPIAIRVCKSAALQRKMHPFLCIARHGKIASRESSWFANGTRLPVASRMRHSVPSVSKYRARARAAEMTDVIFEHLYLSWICVIVASIVGCLPNKNS